MKSFILLFCGFLMPANSAFANDIVCGTFDSHDKYFVRSDDGLGKIQRRVITLCKNRRGQSAACNSNIYCEEVRKPGADHFQRVVAFPKSLQGSGKGLAPRVQVPDVREAPKRHPIDVQIERNRQEEIDRLLECERRCGIDGCASRKP